MRCSVTPYSATWVSSPPWGPHTTPALLSARGALLQAHSKASPSAWPRHAAQVHSKGYTEQRSPGTHFLVSTHVLSPHRSRPTDPGSWSPAVSTPILQAQPSRRRKNFFSPTGKGGRKKPTLLLSINFPVLNIMLRSPVVRVFYGAEEGPELCSDMDKFGCTAASPEGQRWGPLRTGEPNCQGARESFVFIQRGTEHQHVRSPLPCPALALPGILVPPASCQSLHSGRGSERVIAKE